MLERQLRGAEYEYRTPRTLSDITKNSFPWTAPTHVKARCATLKPRGSCPPAAASHEHQVRKYLAPTDQRAEVPGKMVPANVEGI